MNGRERRLQRKRRRARQLTAGAGATVGATLLMGGSAQAVSTFQVNSLEDPTDTGHVTLHDAMVMANANPDDSVITFASGLSGSLDLTANLPYVNWSTDIQGPGADKVTVDAHNARRIFHAVGLANPGLQISGLTLKDGNNTADVRGGALFVAGGSPVAVSNTVWIGNTAGEGGAIYSLNGTLDVQRSTFIGNSATAEDGGGAISSYGTALTISDSVVSGNDAYVAGGIRAERSGTFGSMEMQDSTVSGNTSDDCCAGLLSQETATTQIHNSTISGNIVSSGPSGGMYVRGPLTVTGSTIVGNVATTAGGGIYGSLIDDPAVLDSIVAGNLAAYGPDVKNDVNAAFSLFGNTSGATINATAPGSNLTGVNPQLGSLAQNGGPTPTMKPAATSPVIDRGSAFGLGADQRGLARTFDAPTIPQGGGSDGTDIGAVELQASDVPPAPPVPGSPAKPKCKKKKHKRSAASAKKKKCKKKRKKKG
jgi:predicted outer membrane repeat protein